MARRNLPKKLLVEGEEDKRVIPQLIEANGIRWGENRDTWIVEIDQCDGFENMVREGLIEIELKASGLKVLGIIADANENAKQRWSSLRNRCLGIFPELTGDVPAAGLIQENESGLKLGVWLMPNNRSHGMMETFLTYLVPDNSNPVLKYAESARDDARALGAPYKDVHADKAKIHTWLGVCRTFLACLFRADRLPCRHVHTICECRSEHAHVASAGSSRLDSGG